MRSNRQFWLKSFAVLAVSVLAIRCAPALLSVVINSGEATTNIRQVTLNINSPAVRVADAASMYMASESPTFAGAVWQPFTSSAEPFTLSSGDGLKIVYVKMRNAAGQESLVRSDTINLAEVIPQRWSRAVDIFGGSADEGYGIAPTGDGGYIACGLSVPSGGNGSAEATLVKLGANGATQGAVTFGDTTHDEILDVVRGTLDGGVVAAGGIYNAYTGNTHLYVVKYSENLDKVWESTFPLSDTSPQVPPLTSTTPFVPVVLTSYATDVLVLASGGYIITGTSVYDPINHTSGNMFLVRVDNDGNLMNWREYGVSGGVRLGGGVTQTVDGNLVICGQTIVGGKSTAFVLKALSSLTNRTQDFSVMWSGTYYGDLASSIVPSPDGGVVYCGFTAVGHDFSNVSFIARLTIDGVQDNAFGQAFGNTGVDRLTSLAQDLDGGYVLAGSTSSYGNGKQAYLVKTDSQGQLVFYKTYGNINTDDAKSVIVTSDGGYAMCGFTETGGGPRGGDFYIIKTDSLGTTSSTIQP